MNNENDTNFVKNANAPMSQGAENGKEVSVLRTFDTGKLKRVDVLKGRIQGNDISNFLKIGVFGMYDEDVLSDESKDFSKYRPILSSATYNPPLKAEILHPLTSAFYNRNKRIIGKDVRKLEKTEPNHAYGVYSDDCGGIRMQRYNYQYDVGYVNMFFPLNSACVISFQKFSEDGDADFKQMTLDYMPKEISGKIYEVDLINDKDFWNQRIQDVSNNKYYGTNQKVA